MRGWVGGGAAGGWWRRFRTLEATRGRGKGGLVDAHRQ